MLTCEGEVGPKPEECNGKDDDCDGTIDEDPTNILCPDGRCVAGQCSPFCDVSEFAERCPNGRRPEIQPNSECLCIVDECDQDACADMTIASLSAVPWSGARSSCESAWSASIRADEKSVSCVAVLPKTTTASRSDAGFARTKPRAACRASTIACPFIDRERSIASTTYFWRPRFSARSPATG